MRLAMQIGSVNASSNAVFDQTRRAVAAQVQ